MSCHLPGGVHSPDQFWEFLCNGCVSDTKIPAARIPTRNRLLSNYNTPVEGGNFLCENVADFDAAFFGITRNEANAMDPQQRILLECVHECVENSGIQKLDNDTGLVASLDR